MCLYLVVKGGFSMAKNTHSNRRRGSIALNIFAVVFALMPLFTMSLWTYQQFFSDPRRTQELATVQSAENPRLFEESLLSVTFDDGWESVYSEAAPIMSEYGVVSTQYILPSQFPAYNYMSANQALSMQDTNHEISSHTYSHKNLTTINEKEVDGEIAKSVDVLSQLNLLPANDRTFAAPNGALDTPSLRRVQQDFVLARNVMGDLSQDVSSNDMNIKENFDRYDVIGYTVGSYTTTEELRAALQYAKANNAWFIPVYHQIDDSGDKYSVTPGVFEQHVELYVSSGIKIATMRDVVINNQEYMR